MSEKSLARAREFLEREQQFHLGFLPTEQSHPLTRNLEREFAESAAAGVRCLQRVDDLIPPMFRQVFPSPAYRKLADSMLDTVRNGKRVVFSGCGATGRLSILLEAMWREACCRHPRMAACADRVESIMTGGDYALVKSVESFEDYQIFGRRQVQEAGLGAGDTLVAITEGGETSSVLGTLFEAVDRGCRGFLLFNNPAAVLCEKLERSRRAITDPRVTVLDLSCGPMALAGSTRMQATTCEQLVAGSALEAAFCRLAGLPVPDAGAEFSRLLAELSAPAAVAALAAYLDFEAGIYRGGGLLTYFAGECLPDIFTDTTERSPTFMLPPFRPQNDTVSPRPWAFVKHPQLTTAQVWEHYFHRPLRCLEWNSADYHSMGAPAALVSCPPAIGVAELLQFQVGCENIADRIVSGGDAAVLLRIGEPEAELTAGFTAAAAGFPRRAVLALGGRGDGADFFLPCTLPDTPLRLTAHLAVKLALNTISTGIMVKLGRVTGNWMSWVNISNKKLMDRAIRLISEIGGISYEESCRRLFAAAEELQTRQKASDEKVSCVQYVLEELRRER